MGGRASLAVRNRFDEVLVLDGPASREQGRLLTTLADLRQQADYGYEPIDVDRDSLLDRTRSLVESIGELVDEWTDSDDAQGA